MTEGHLARHYQGVRGGRDAALLDIAQDHVLYLLHQAGAFDAGLVFKGGTALRKFRAGSAGRFSTDLDFAAPSEELALSVLAALDGVEIDGFSFAISNLGDDGRRGDLVVETPFGHPQLGAKVELARHALSLPADLLSPIAMPIHDRYAFSVPPTPVVRVEEAIAEKLARYRRVSLARDLYDLQWFGSTGAFDRPLVRRSGSSRRIATWSWTGGEASRFIPRRSCARGPRATSDPRTSATSPNRCGLLSGSTSSAAATRSSPRSMPRSPGTSRATPGTCTPLKSTSAWSTILRCRDQESAAVAPSPHALSARTAKVDVWGESRPNEAGGIRSSHLG